MRPTTLIEKIDAVKSQVLAELREEVIRAASDETEVDAEGVVALLGQAGLDSGWFQQELDRCRSRLQAQSTLKEIEREESPTGGASLASAEHRKASQALKELLVRHKQELKAARARLTAAGSKATALGAVIHRRRKEATDFLFRSVGREHREKLSQAEHDLELLQSRLAHLESMVPHDDDLRRANQDLEYLSTLDPSPDVAEKIDGLRGQVESYQNDQQTHFERLQDLRQEIDAGKREVDRLRQLCLDPLKTF